MTVFFLYNIKYIYQFKFIFSKKKTILIIDGIKNVYMYICTYLIMIAVYMYSENVNNIIRVRNEDFLTFNYHIRIKWCSSYIYDLLPRTL